MPYIDEKGKDCERDMNILISDPVNQDKRTAWARGPMYRCQFSLRIPDHIWNFLAGKRIPDQSGSGVAVSIGYGKTAKEFPKTLSEPSLINLCHSWRDLLQHYRWRQRADKEGFKRVIFYRFDLAFDQEYHEEYGRKHPGGMTKIAFTYAPGYLLPDKNESYEHRFDAEMNAIHRGNDRKFYELKYVKWSAEREAFFQSLQVNFEQVIGRIDDFIKGITEKNINKLMAGQRKLLGE